MKRVFLVFTLLFGIQSHAGLEIAVRSQVAARVGDRILFGDMIETQALTAEQRTGLATVTFLESLEPDRKHFSSAEISQLIARNQILRQKIAHINLRIPASIEVITDENKQWPQTHEIEKMIKEAIQAECSDCDVMVKDLSIPMKPPGSLSAVTIKTSGINLRGSFTLPLQYKTEDKIRSAWITGRTSWRKQALSAKRLINLGEKISPDDFVMDWADVTHLRDALGTEKMLIGATTARSIAMGKPILFSDLKREPLVQKGQAIKILVGSLDFEISASGIAEQNGFIGEVVRIKFGDGQKILSGVVVEKGTVRVE